MTKAVDAFQAMVNERGDLPRRLTYEQLKQLADEPVEYVVVDSRRGKIATIVQQGMLPSGAVRVVIQGFL